MTMKYNHIRLYWLLVLVLVYGIYEVEGSCGKNNYTCSYNGVCVTGSCQCQELWFGDTCDIFITDIEADRYRVYLTLTITWLSIPLTIAIILAIYVTRFREIRGLHITHRVGIYLILIAVALSISFHCIMFYTHDVIRWQFLRDAGYPVLFTVFMFQVALWLETYRRISSPKLSRSLNKRRLYIPSIICSILATILQIISSTMRAARWNYYVATQIYFYYLGAYAVILLTSYIITRAVLAKTIYKFSLTTANKTVSLQFQLLDKFTVLIAVFTVGILIGVAISVYNITPNSPQVLLSTNYSNRFFEACIYSVYLINVGASCYQDFFDKYWKFMGHSLFSFKNSTASSANSGYSGNDKSTYSGNDKSTQMELSMVSSASVNENSTINDSSA